VARTTTRVCTACEELCAQFSDLVSPVRSNKREVVLTAHVGSSACATAPHTSNPTTKVDLKNISKKKLLVVQIKPQRTDTNVQKTQTPQINTPNHDIPVESRIPRRKLQHTFYVNPRATTFLFPFNIDMVHVQTDPGTRAWPLKTDLRSPFDSPGDACRLDCFEMCVQRSRHASMECGSSAQRTHCLFPTCDQSREMHGGLVYWVFERVADVRGDGRRPIELGVRFGRCGWCGSNGPSRDGWN
jgi:hypothetical protein